MTSRTAPSSTATLDASVLTDGGGDGGWLSASTFLLISVRYRCASAACGPFSLTIATKLLRGSSLARLSLINLLQQRGRVATGLPDLRRVLARGVEIALLEI